MERLPGTTVLVLLASMGLWSITHAQGTKLEAARALFQEGNTLYKKGDFEGALKKYEAAREHYPSFKIDITIATALGNLKRNADALREYQRLLSKLDRRAPDDAVDRARREVRRLKQLVATVTVSGGPSGAAVNIDGEHLSLVPSGESYLDPGLHLVAISKPGFEPRIEKLTLGAGERRELRIRLKPTSKARGERGAQAPNTEQAAALERGRLEIAGMELVTGIGFWRSSQSRCYIPPCLYIKSDSGFAGVGAVLRLATLRWKHLFWTVLETSYVSAASNQQFAAFGTRVGLQLNPGSSTRLRLQIGLALGYSHLAIPSVVEPSVVDNETIDRTDNQFTMDGFWLSPTVHASYRVSGNLSVGGGVRMPMVLAHALTVPNSDLSYLTSEGNGIPVLLLFGASISWLR